MRAFVREVGSITLLLRDGVLAMGRADRREVAAQAYELANRSTLFVALTMGFMGTILVSEAAEQAERLVGDTTIIGPSFLQLLIGEFGPALVALMLAARYGAGAAAEIATMRVTEQVDALRMSGADPAAYLVAPRLWAGLLGCVPMTVVGIGAAYGCGAVAGRVAFDIPWSTYFGLQMVRGGDVVVSVCKTFLFGVAVPLMACRAGLQAVGGAPGVGRATTLATVRGLVLLLCLDFITGLTGFKVRG
jgi:phospholipid/cholesterol/gamma-HCH transport system permease protein